MHPCKRPACSPVHAVPAGRDPELELGWEAWARPHPLLAACTPSPAGAPSPPSGAAGCTKGLGEGDPSPCLLLGSCLQTGPAWLGGGWACALEISHEKGLVGWGGLCRLGREPPFYTRAHRVSPKTPEHPQVCWHLLEGRGRRPGHPWELSKVDFLNKDPVPQLLRGASSSPGQVR